MWQREKTRLRVLPIVYLLIVHESKWQGSFLKQNAFQDCSVTCCLAYRPTSTDLHQRYNEVNNHNDIRSALCRYAGSAGTS